MSRLSLCVAYLRWAASLHYFWATVALLAATVTILMFDHPKQEACIRWWGMLLQFLGIVMVVRDQAIVQFGTVMATDTPRQ